MFPIKNIIIAILIPMTAACSSSGTHENVASRPVVTVSIPPQKWFVDAVAGDSIDVNVLLSSGTNPETFEPGMAAMRRAADSRAVLITGGLPFEAVLAEKLGAANIVDTSAGVVPLYRTHDHCEHHDHAHEQELPDPHTWTSVKNGRIIAHNIYNTLVDIDPENKDYYATRYQALDARLDSLDKAIACQLDTAGRGSFLVMHPSLGYFARDYGLTQVSIGQEGRESSVKGLRRQLDRAADNGVDVLFVQAEFDSRQARAIAGQVDAKVTEINLLNSDWESEINHIVDALTSN